MNFSLVPFGNISLMMPYIAKYLHESEQWTKGRAQVDDIMAFIYSGQMNLWVVYNDKNEVFGHLVTEVKQYPRGKFLVVQYCAADPQSMKLVEDKVFDTLDAYAKDAGCIGVEFFGRPGWAPYAKKHGFTSRTTVFEKYFGDQS